MTKEKLRSYGHLLREKNQILEQIKRLESLIYSPRTQNLTGMPAQFGQEKDKLANPVAALQELRELYNQKLQELAELCREIEEAIDKLDGVSRLILRARYIECKKWEEICVELNYGWAHLHRLHAEALKKIADY